MAIKKNLFEHLPDSHCGSERQIGNQQPRMYYPEYLQRLKEQNTSLPFQTFPAH